jgi:2-C-methyl-D-erythritol 4-phosphate cytidylyltransferase
MRPHLLIATMPQSPSALSPFPRCYAVIPCAGVGARAGVGGPKQYQPVAGLPVVQYTLNAFLAVPQVQAIAVVVAPGDDFWRAPQPEKVQVAPCGGATRAHSVFNGLAHLREHGATDHDWVLVHDAARCLVTPAQIQALMAACLPDAVGGLLALPLPDTLKQADDAGRVAATVPRADKWLAQTPQMFRLGDLHRALAAAEPGGFVHITDEASAIEALGLRPLLVPGSAENFKLTYPPDFALAESILKGRQA